MTLVLVKRAVLQYLFEIYQENPTAVCDITQIITNHQQDPHEFGKHLVNNGWVKNHQYRPQSFVCQISLEGINEIDPGYFESIKQDVISTLGINDGQQSIMEILGYEPKNYQRAFDVVKSLEAEGWIKGGLYVSNDVIIELSLEGKDYYDQNKAEFIK